MGRPPGKDGLGLREVETDGGGNLLSAFQDGRTDINLQEIVLSGSRQRIPHIEVMLNQHVRGASHVDSVDKDLGKAVDAAEVQEEVIVFCILRALEVPAVPPLVSLVRPQEINITPEFRFFDESGGQQVQLHIAGHSGRNGVETDSFHSFGESDRRPALLPEIQRPGAVQGEIIGPGGDNRRQYE